MPAKKQVSRSVHHLKCRHRVSAWGTSEDVSTLRDPLELALLEALFGEYIILGNGVCAFLSRHVSSVLLGL
jgi:hypothetical protein